MPVYAGTIRLAVVWHLVGLYTHCDARFTGHREWHVNTENDGRNDHSLTWVRLVPNCDVRRINSLTEVIRDF